MFASTAFGQLRYIPETTAGVTPVVGNGINLRTTGPDMKAAVQSVVSQEISPKRMVSSSTNVDLTVDGGFAFEMSSKEYDPFMLGVIGAADWTHYGTSGLGTQFGMTTTAGVVTADVAPTGTSAFSNLAAGDWFQIIPDASASDAVKDYFRSKWLRVHATTAPTSTTITLDPTTQLGGAGLIAVALQAAVTSSKAVNGSNRSSFTLEWDQTDITQYLAFRGMRPNTMSLNFAVGAILTGNFGFFGQTHTIAQTSGMPNAPTFTASQSGDVMNSVTDMGVLTVGSNNVLSGGTSFVHNVKLDLTNNLRGQKALGVFGNAGVGYGEFAVSGTMECYFEDQTLYEMALNGDNTSLHLGVSDIAGNGYLYSMPKVKFKDPGLNLGNKDSDVMLSLPFQAFYQESLGHGFSVYRSVAA